MATVTGLTAERMLEIEAASVVDGDVVAGNLILTKHDGSQINAGSVVGPTGPQGPVGSDTEILAAKPVLEVGILDQIRAGRAFFDDDFTNLGLSAPLGLWNLSNLLDSSGFGRNLVDKGSVPFAVGINGFATTAAQFAGSTAQVLYIVDTGVSDPFRIKTGSVGCWFRTSKQGVAQSLITKRGAAGNLGYWFRISSGNVLEFGFSSTGTDVITCLGLTNVADGRWHFGVFTYDGNLCRLSVDGVVEDVSLYNLLIFGSSGPLNIGGYQGDAGTLCAEPHFGRIDEAFVTADVLTEDQARNLYCARVAHGLNPVIPSRIALNIRRRRKGAALASGDFPALPLRLYNFSAGSLGNEGSDGVAGNLTNTGPAVAVNNAFHFVGTQRLTSTDAGLPDALLPVTYGCWIKTVNMSATMYIITWGTTNGTNDTRLYVAAGAINFGSGSNVVAGPVIADGQWHHIVVVQDNAAADGVKRKLYVDGRLVATSLVMNSVTLGGASKFVIGQSLASTNAFAGEIDSVFVEDAAYIFDNIFKIYNKSSQELPISPKNPGDHVEGVTVDELFVIFDTLESASQVDLTVSP